MTILRAWVMRALPFARAVAFSTLAFGVMAWTFHIVAGSLVYLPHLTWPRQARYGLGLYGEDYVTLAVVLALLHGVAAVWRRGYWVTLVALGVVGVVRLVHFDALLESGEFLSEDALLHLELAYLFLTPGRLVKYGVATLGFLGVAFGLRRLYLRDLDAPERLVPPRLAVALVGALALVVTWALGYAALSPKHRRNWPQHYAIDVRSPERALLTTLTNTYMPARRVAQDVGLSSDDARALAAFGIHAQPDAPLPLVNSRAYDAALPRRDGAVRKPNVVVIFFEGLSDRLLGRTTPHGSVTPHLDAFAAAHTRATRHFNHTTPTVLGLVGQLCSFYPVASHEAWLASVKPERAQLSCLPHVLDANGYDTVYLNHGQPRFTRLGDVSKSVGFGRALFGEEVARVLGLPHTRGDRTDAQMLQAAVHVLRERRAEEPPVFLAISTLDFHPPFVARERALGDAPGPLQILHATDAAFGDFVTKLAELGLDDETLVIVTGDHAVLPNQEIVELVRDDTDYTRSPYDRVAMLIASPGHDLPRRIDKLTSTVDLAPTVAHLLDLPVTQPWMGRSIFDARERAGVFGSQASHNFVLDARTTPPLRYDFNVRAPATDAEPELVALYRRWFAWHTQLIAEERIWRR